MKTLNNFPHYSQLDAMFMRYLAPYKKQIVQLVLGLLHMNTKINISLISDYLAKLMKLPLHLFDTKMIGDTMQRIADYSRIESFLTGSSITALLSLCKTCIFQYLCPPTSNYELVFHNKLLCFKNI